MLTVTNPSWPFAFVGFLLLGIIHCSSGESVSSAPKPDPETLWGPFRPNLYFGIKPRIPKSLSFGLMWTSADKNGHLIPETLRHACQQEDRLDVYGWTNYNVRTGGSQRFGDSGNAVNLTVDFIKSEDGASWGVRVKGQPRDRSLSKWNLSTVFYMSLEGTNSPDSSRIKCSQTESSTNEANPADVTCGGTTNQLGNFQIVFPTARSDILHTLEIKARTIEDELLWKAKGKSTQASDLANSW
jgi:mannosyl-oligosaccharide glucosidase